MKIEEKDIDKLLEYEGIIYSIINRYNGYQDREDLYQVGMIGLKKALDNYDIKQNCKFSTYAYKYVLGEITEYMRNNSNLKVSRGTLKKKQLLTKTKEILRQKLLREPTSIELSLVLEMEEKEVIELENLTTETKSLDYEFLETEYNLYNSIKTEDNATKPEIMDLKIQLDQLSPEDKQLIYSRYFANLSQTETSTAMGISQAKVSRKETKILQKLRENL